MKKISNLQKGCNYSRKDTGATSPTNMHIPCRQGHLLYNPNVWVYVCVYSVLSTLWGPMDCSPPGSSVHEIFQARILERVAASYSRPSWPREWTPISCIAGGFFTTPPPDITIKILKAVFLHPTNWCKNLILILLSVPKIFFVVKDFNSESLIT